MHTNAIIKELMHVLLFHIITIIFCLHFKAQTDLRFSEQSLWAKHHCGVVRPGQNRWVKHTMANCFVKVKEINEPLL